MHDKYKPSVVSPDGRFEVIIEEDYDRGIYSCNTVLVDRATGKQLFTCQDAPRAVFAEDGILTIHYPGYEPYGVMIDPAHSVLRTHPSEPWVSTFAWRLVEFAYQRGWSDGRSSREPSQPTQFPWVAICLMLGSIVALPVLGAQSLITGLMRVALLAIATIGFLFFGWLVVSDVRSWAQERSRE